MTTLSSISTGVHTLTWKPTTEKSQSQPPEDDDTTRLKKYRSHVYASFTPIATLIFTCLFGFLGPGLAGTSCTQTLKLLATPTFQPISAPTSYEPWAVSQLLAINLGLGSMPFTTAKFIDVFWDVVVGRGGQMLLTYVAYRVFTKSLARAMEDSQVSYHTFAALAFEPGTIAGVFMLAKDFASNRCFRSKMVVSWVLMATLHIIAFPTLSSAMTGYTSVMGVYMEDHNQNLVPWKLYRSIWCIIEDADRIDPHLKRQTPVFLDLTDELLTSTEDCTFYSQVDFSYRKLLSRFIHRFSLKL